jgi:hypothetical protein
MATATEVMEMIRPQGGWSVSGDSFEGINCFDCNAVTKEEFEAGFAQYDAWKAQQEAEAQAKRQALLDRLGITAEEARLLLG